MPLAKSVYSPYISPMATKDSAPISKPCEHCGDPILQTRNNKSEWATIRFCGTKCRRMFNRKAMQNGTYVEDEPEPTRIEMPNPHVNWRPKGKKHQPK
ncbi:MAG: hypothetical protein DI585_01115 [Pseudomonas fluorescens]|nr:MAG: hypothetical protein DI585_01115 [Pseudomonas fluorescens]